MRIPRTRSVFIALTWFLWRNPCVAFTTGDPSKAIYTGRLVIVASQLHSYNELLDWVVPNNDGSTMCVLSIRSSQYPGGGMGLFVTKDVPTGTILLTVPESHVISVENAWSDDLWGDAFCYLSEEGGEAGRMAALAGLVAIEMFKGSQSRWYPYLSSLPIGLTDLDHLLWWSDEDIRMVEGSNIYEEVISLRKNTIIAMEILQQALQTTSSSELHSKEQWDSNVRAAYVAILSRSFEDDNLESSKLVPLLDMAQHSASPNLEHFTDAVTGEVIVKARRDLMSGEELSIDYSLDLKPNQFFPLYSFVPNQQKPCRLLFTEKSSIFFP